MTDTPWRLEFDSSRTFQVWDYRVSHAQMLIRSPRSGSAHDPASNEDLIFLGVEHISIPTLLRGIRIVQGTEADLKTTEARLGLRESKTRRLFLFGGDVEGHVVAAHLMFARTTSDFMVSSLVLHFSPKEGETEAYERQYLQELANIGRP